MWHFEPDLSWRWKIDQVNDFLQCLGLEFQLQFGFLEHYRHSLLDFTVDPFYHAVLHGCIWNDLLVLDPFVGKVMFKGSGSIFTSAARPNCLHSVSWSVLHLGQPLIEYLEPFIFEPNWVGATFRVQLSTTMMKYREPPNDFSGISLQMLVCTRCRGFCTILYLRECGLRVCFPKWQCSQKSVFI